MDITLNANALMDLDTFYTLYQQLVDPTIKGDGADQDQMVVFLINAVSTAFERFCNRPLVHRTFHYDDGEADYAPEYTIFDPPPYNTFWFPTYPVTAITSFLIRGTAITETTDNLATDGYVLYKKTGKLIYDQGFDIGYYKTINVAWAGGYQSTDVEYHELQSLLFQTIKSLRNQPRNPILKSEKIGQYAYETHSAYLVSVMKGLAPEVFQGLGRYRREPIG